MTRFSQVVTVAAMVAAAAVAMAAPGDTQKREAQLQALLVDKLGDDAKTIRVTIDGLKAILTGQVSSRPTQELCQEVALYFSGIEKVDNQVKATHDDSLGKGLVKDETADADLEMTVKMKLRSEIGTHAEKIEVEVCAGIVSLRGVAPEEARKTIALKTAAGVKGVKKVIDLLRLP
jgi:osmotically-inducible protein OsmY